MEAAGWDGCLKEILDISAGTGWRIDTPHVRQDVTAYLVPSFGNDALLFSVPVLFTRSLADEIPLGPEGSDGAVHALIERIKQRAHDVSALGPLAGTGTKFPHRYDANVEPYTVVHSQEAIASHLWHPDDRNFCDREGIHLLIHGALPCPPAQSPQETRRITETMQALFDSISSEAEAMPVRVLTNAWENSLDQKLLRNQLPELGLVAFAGDGSRPARSFSRHRSSFRTAGKKEGVNIPFACPQELSPVEIDLPATGERITGLGIKRREVFSVTGSNAQGKTTFLNGIIAGMDDHAAGDGRERIVTVRGATNAEAMNCELPGVDVSMFFKKLPPGIGGTPKAAYGAGSGSMTMAAMVQKAIAGSAPLLLIDEDRAAPNLLVKSCLQKEDVTPLAEILAHDRSKMDNTTLLFAACAMDTLIVQADRIMVLDQHVAGAIDRNAFRAMLKESLLKTAERLG
ncbi:MAG: putative ATPase of the ABC class [Methanoregula sp. PtaU1.Bin051]|nr:MAG: putative ATPase of the ABC class [Methanoregula sp. PtaU1.Bin051]